MSQMSSGTGWITLVGGSSATDQVTLCLGHIEGRLKVNLGGTEYTLDQQGGGGPHTHLTSEIIGLDAALAGKAALSHSHIIGDVTGLQTALDGKSAASHTHPTSQVVGLDTALAGKAAIAHTHALTDLAQSGAITGQVPTWSGSAWAPATPAAGGGPTIVKNTSDQTINTTTPQNVTGLVFSVTSGRYYHFRFVCLVQSNTATVGVRATVTHPGATRFGATCATIIAADGTAAAFHGAITASGDAVIPTAVPAINTDYVLTIEGLLLASATGNLQLQAGTETGTTNVIIRQGSCGLLTDLGT